MTPYAHIHTPATICAECGNTHSYENNFDKVKTIIDVLPELFPKYFKTPKSSPLDVYKLDLTINGEVTT